MKKKPSQQRDAVVLTWKPRLKNAKPGSRSLSTSGTMHAADQALSAMRTIDRMRTRHGEVQESQVATLADRLRPPAAARPAPVRRPAAAPPGQDRGWLAVATAVACGLWLVILVRGALAPPARRPGPGAIRAGQRLPLAKPLSGDPPA